MKSAFLLDQLRDKDIELFDKVRRAAAIPFPAAAP